MSQAQNAQALASQAQVGANYVQYDAEGNRITYSNVQVARNQAYFNRAGNWEDSRYREGQSVVKVRAFSDAYFQLSERFPSVNQALSFHENVLVLVNSQAVQIGAEGKERFTERELEELGAEEKKVPEAAFAPPSAGLPLGLVIVSVAAVGLFAGFQFQRRMKG